MARHLQMVPLHQARSVADPACDVHEDAPIDLAVIRLRRAILALPPLERLVLELRWGLNGRQQLSKRKVGRWLGLSIGQVAALERRAMDALRGDEELRKAVAA